jgi:hypothetical protein
MFTHILASLEIGKQTISAPELRKLITQLGTEEIFPLKDFLEPFALVEEYIYEDRIGLEETFKATFRGLALRIQKRRAAESRRKRPTNKEKRNPKGPKNNPLTSLQGAPGSGKSYFLQELSYLRKADLDNFCEDEDLKGILSKCVAITISYNTAMCDGSPADIDLDRGLAFRILYRFVILLSSKDHEPTIFYKLAFIVTRKVQRSLLQTSVS